MTADQVARDLCRVIDDVPVTFKYLGVAYEGTRGPLVTTKSVVPGGIFEAPELSITTSTKKINSSGKLVNRFSTALALQKTIEDVGGVSGRDYRIVRLHEDEFGIGVQMDLESIHK